MNHDFPKRTRPSHLGVFAFYLRATLVITTLIIVSLPALAQVSPKVTVQPQQGDLQTPFMLSITFSGRDIPTQAPRPEAQSSDFEVRYIGPSSTYEFVNGQSSAKRSFNYRLVPKQTGTLKTPKFMVRGMELRPLTVKVSKSASRTAPKNTVFLRQASAPKRVYQGQQIVNRVDIGYRVPLRNSKLGDLTSEDFWQVSFGKESNSTRVVKGYRYDVTTLKQALFPLKSGTLEIPRRKFTARVPMRSHSRAFDLLDPFDFSFGSIFKAQNFEQITVYSEPIKITVAELPTLPNGKTDQAPIVGTTSWQVSSQSLALKVGQSAQFTVTVTSDGNLDALQDLEISEPEGISLYREETKRQRMENQGRLFTRQTYSYSLVATQAGQTKLKLPEVLTLDLKSKGYKTVGGDIVKIFAKGKSADQPTGTQVATLTPLPTPKSENFLTVPSLKASDFFTVRTLLLLVLLIPSRALLTVWLRGRQNRLQAKKELLRRIRAASSAIELRELIENQLFPFIISELSTESITAIKAARGLEEKLKRALDSKVRDKIFSITQLIDLIDEAAFRPVDQEQLNLDELKNQTVRLVR